MARFKNPVPYAFDDNGDPIVGAELYFYETGTTTLKTIYSDSALSTPTTNPQIAVAGGRFTGDIFLDGIYKVVLKDDSSVTIWTKDPVGDIVEGQFELWISGNTYNIPEIVLGSDDEYYRSLTDGNQGNDPITSPSNWEQLQFGRIWNTNITYSVGESVYASDGFLYFSKTASNSANDPTSSPDDWERDNLDSSDLLNNISFTAAVATKALTFDLKTKNGIDPTATDSVKIGFRNSTLTTGDYNIREVTSALSVVIPSGATLGFAANEEGYIYNYAIDNIGTVEAAVSGAILDETALHTTVAIDATADSRGVLYSTAARTDAAIRYLGKERIATGAVAGEWDNAPTELHVGASVEAYPAFKANRNGVNQTGIVTATDTIIQFDTEVRDTHGYFDTSTYRFTPLVAGDYIVVLSANFNNVTSSLTETTATIFFNGSARSAFRASAPVTITNGLLVTDLIAFNGSTDYVDFRIRHNDASNQTLTGNDAWNYAMAWRVR